MSYQVLLVEDHPALRVSCMLFLNRSPDLQVCAAIATGEEALLQVPVLKPDLVLADISLPGISGLELTLKLRAANLQLPILLMTGHADEHYTQDARQAGANDFIFKHEGPNALLLAIRRLLVTPAN